MFQELGPDARALLEVVAFFPQGIDENNIDWLFPSIPNRGDIFDKFCTLSLTYRSNDFATMLAPLRDHLRPKDPKSSPLLCATKKHYFSRLSAGADPDNPDFEGSRWITSEDVNVEHLLDVFTSADANSDDVWNACAHFVGHLSWHKRRLVMLGPKIEELPDDHPSKPQCLFQLSRLFDSIGNFSESKRLLTHTLQLQRERGDDLGVAQTLTSIADDYPLRGTQEEQIMQAKEASKIYERLGHMTGQVDSLQRLALLLAEDDQADAAEVAASRAIDLSLGKPTQSQAVNHHNILSHICHSRGDTEAAINHLKTALGTTPLLGSQDGQTAIFRRLLTLLIAEERFDDAQVQLERFKSKIVNDPRNLGLAMVIQGRVWFLQNKLEEARSELSCALDLYEKIGLSGGFLWHDAKSGLEEIERKMNSRVTPPSDESGDDGELFGTCYLSCPL